MTTRYAVAVTVASLAAFGLGLVVGRYQPGHSPPLSLDPHQPVLLVGPDTTIRLQPTGYRSNNGHAAGDFGPWQLLLGQSDGSRYTVFCRPQSEQ